VLGALSMIFWALIIVVAVKYVLLIMRADNQGEAVFWLMPLLDIFQTSRGRRGLLRRRSDRPIVRGQRPTRDLTRVA